MPYSQPIDSYDLSLASFEKFNEWKANIILRSNNKVVVDLRFVENPADYVELQSIDQNGVSLVYDNIQNLPIYLDILRNEKPLRVTLYENVTGQFARCLLAVNAEPIGENENTGNP